ncbi:MAG TPA: hypothetical protein VN838_02355 [Bradyrhizobium sp.]|nr:hypothetical protein [Bradyrhizobium sp.]
MADKEQLKPDDFPVHTEQKKIVKPDARILPKQALRNRGRGCRAAERGRGPPRGRPLGVTAQPKKFSMSIEQPQAQV